MPTGLFTIPVILSDPSYLRICFETTCRFTWAPGLQNSACVGTTTNVHATAALPEKLVLGPAYVISTVTVGIGANTNYGAPIALIEEYDDYPAHLF